MQTVSPMIDAANDRGSLTRFALAMGGALVVHAGLIGVAVLAGWIATPPPPEIDERLLIVEMAFPEPVEPATPPPPSPPPPAPEPKPAPTPVVKSPPPRAPTPAPAPSVAPSSAPVSEPVAFHLPSPSPSPSPASTTPVALPVAEPFLPPSTDAAYLRNPKPEYPLAARKRAQQGTTALIVAVSPDGRVEAVRIKASSGHAVLDDAAIKAVRRWRFVPAQRGGAAVAAEVEVPIRFSLSAAPPG